MQASEEQRAIIEALSHGNVIVDAVPGSGKTTTVLFVAQHYLDQRILLLTYNKALTIETQLRVDQLQLKNITVKTFHAYCGYLYGKTCSNDTKMRLLLTSEPKKIDAYGIIILDEAQDMRMHFVELVRKVLNNSKLCVLGDRYQSIYDYDGSDYRYLSLANECYRSPHTWSRKTLSTSFRLTAETALFINTCVVGYNRIKTVKSGSRPTYSIANVFRIDTKLVNWMCSKYAPEDIFILAPSVRSPKSPVRKLANYLSGLDKPIYVTSDDGCRLDAEIIKGKTVVGTYHSAKGLERKVCMVFGVDASYSKFYNSHAPEICSCAMYVALSRASELLIMVHDENSDYLSFIDRGILPKYANVSGKIKCVKVSPPRPSTISVIDLVRHLPSELLDRVLSTITITTTKTDCEWLDIPIKIKQNELSENVSDINGTAIPILEELISTKHSTVRERLDQLQLLPDTPLSNVSNLLKVANYWNSTLSGYNYKTVQIVNYDWVDMPTLMIGVDRIANFVTAKTSREVKFASDAGRVILNGVVDAVDISPERVKVYEWKCVESLTQEHIAQLVCYAYLVLDHSILNNIPMREHRFTLFNVYDCTSIVIAGTYDQLKNIVMELVAHKYRPTNPVTDEQFLASVRCK